MKHLTLTNLKLAAIAVLFTLALSIDLDSVIDKVTGSTVEGEAVSVIDYRYEYGREDDEIIA